MIASNPLRSINPQEQADFHRDGAVLLKEIMPPEWSEVLAQGLEYANDHPDGMSAGVGAPLRIDQFPASHSPDLQRFLDDSPVAEIVGSAIDAPVSFYMDQMFYKPAGMIFPVPGIKTRATTMSKATSWYVPGSVQIPPLGKWVWNFCAAHIFGT